MEGRWCDGAGAGAGGLGVVVVGSGWMEVGKEVVTDVVGWWEGGNAWWRWEKSRPRVPMLTSSYLRTGPVAGAPGAPAHKYDKYGKYDTSMTHV